MACSRAVGCLTRRLALLAAGRRISRRVLRVGFRFTCRDSHRDAGVRSFSRCSSRSGRSAQIRSPPGYIAVLQLSLFHQSLATVFLCMWVLGSCFVFSMFSAVNCCRMSHVRFVNVGLGFAFLLGDKRKRAPLSAPLILQLEISFCSYDYSPLTYSLLTISQSSSPINTAAVSTVVHNPRLSPTADCVIFIVRTILLEIR